MPEAPQRHKLTIRSAGNVFGPIELDGQPLPFISRIELALDADGRSEARLTVPAAYLDIDADVAAFLTAHAETDDEAPAINFRR